MSQPTLSKRMRIKINDGVSDYTLGTVELTNIEIFRQGGVESKYGKHGIKVDNRHAIGMKRATFTIRRWHYADEGQESLLYDLYDNTTEFTLEEFVNEPKSSTIFGGIQILNCIAYTYRILGGSANDIVVEEIVGEGLSWDEIYVYPDLVEFDEPLDWGYFKNKGEIWIAEPTSSEGGGYFLHYLVTFPDPFAEQGGGYIDKPATPTLFEYNHVTGIYSKSGGNTIAAQTFTPQAIHDLEKITLKLIRVGNPAGNFIVGIKNTDVNGKPTGSYLVTKSILASTIPTSETNIDFIFDTEINLNTVKYAIILECLQGDDLTNYIEANTGEVDPYGYGDRLWSTDGGSTWTIDTYRDLWFERWGWA